MTSWWLAWRYFWRGRQRFLRLLTTTAIAGVALGIFSLTVVLSVMQGFHQELADRLLGFHPHITLQPKAADALPLDLQKLKSAFQSEIAAADEVVEGEVIASHDAHAGDAPVAGLKVRGMALASVAELPSTELYLPASQESVLPGIVLGHEAAGALLVHPDFEDEVMLAAPLSKVSPTGELIPEMRRFRVAGIFRSGIYEYDSKYAFIEHGEALKLLGAQGTKSIRIRLHDPAGAAGVAAMLNQIPLLQGYEAVAWEEQNQKLFGALKLERMAMGGVLMTIVLIASFSIVGTMLLVTAAKRKDIAMLKALGLPRSAIIRTFLWHGSCIGLLGASIGILFGLAACAVLLHWPLDLPSSYYLDYLPVRVSPLWIFCFGMLGWILSLIASLYPVIRCSREDPCEVLRYE